MLISYIVNSVMKFHPFKVKLDIHNEVDMIISALPKRSMSLEHMKCFLNELQFVTTFTLFGK